MKPIVGQVSYEEITPEDMALYMHRAEMLRAQAISDKLFAVGRGINFVFRGLARATDLPFQPRTADAR
ncbi:MAG: hypothetical protein VW268_04145 [Rhodospirillaceae bacterium]